MTTKKFDLNDPCIFCNPRKDEILAENEYALLITDNSPVSDGHCLVIPRRHIKTLFDATEVENTAFLALIKQAKTIILNNGFLPDGYNIGCNNDIAAGQSVFHLHIHIIPRYLGDVENPKGGIRHVIPRNASYQVKHRS
jgi:diadenosine tetraphosphate (Ap4A) HIT family hydrolase